LLGINCWRHVGTGVLDDGGREALERYARGGLRRECPNIRRQSGVETGDWRANVGGNYYLHVGSWSGGRKRTTIITGMDEIQVTQDANQTIDGHWSTQVGGYATIHANGSGPAAGRIVLNARNEISLVVGESSIVINTVGVFINGSMIQINSGGPTPQPPNDPPPVQRNDPTWDAPNEPTAADPGNSLTPPKWQE